MAQKNGQDYNYEEDYFLNGDSQFDKIMDNLTGMYKDYVHADENSRKEIDSYLNQQRSGIPADEWFRSKEQLTGMRGYIQTMGAQLGVKDLDQRIVAFNDIDHEDTAYDKEQQEALRQDLYAGYKGLSDRDKSGLAGMLERNRDEVGVTIGLNSTSINFNDYGFMPIGDSDSLGNGQPVESRHDGFNIHLTEDWWERQERQTGELDAMNNANTGEINPESSWFNRNDYYPHAGVSGVAGTIRDNVYSVGGGDVAQGSRYSSVAGSGVARSQYGAVAQPKHLSGGAMNGVNGVASGMQAGVAGTRPAPELHRNSSISSKKLTVEEPEAKAPEVSEEKKTSRETMKDVFDSLAKDSHDNRVEAAQALLDSVNEVAKENPFAWSMDVGE